jgi:hypothetical protein
MKNQKGLILVEVITVLVLVGIIGIFTTFFLYTGINGYMNTKVRSEGALGAQMALDRIALELRNINYFTSAPIISGTNGNASLSYKSAVLDGTRVLKYESNNQAIVININGTDYRLLENVTAFSLSVAAEDLNQDGVDDVSSIGVGFHLHEIGKEFKTNIFPRNMVKNK